MLDYKFIKLIETIGCVNENGDRIYGTAALLHFIHRPIESFSKDSIERGKAFVQKYLRT